MIKKALLYGLLLLTGVSTAQIGGKYTYQFLNLVASPRQAALGGRVLTHYDYDVDQPLINPATLNDEMRNRLALSYVNYLGDVNYGSAAYAWHMKAGVFHGGVTYINYGTFDGRNEFGEETGDFTGSEVALSAGYAYNIPESGFYVGANVKLISSALEQYHSFGGALDIGGVYLDTINRLSVALVIRNAGMQFSTYAGEREKLPLEIAAGISQELKNVPIRWHLTFENLQNWNLAFANPVRTETTLDGEETPEKVTVIKEFFRHTVIGAELFPDRGFSIRLGYNFRRGEELRVLEQRNFSGLSAGFGVRINKVRFNYSFARYSTAANTSLFGLMINFR
ncbi:MAG: type IX secretion system protein PorQ [Sinomicrobium sp.]|nr:type IX secretion system protein PorQ [Sinomicrobium sp.]